MSRLSVEIRGWIGLLLALQLLTSFAGIGLLARVSPAVDLILRENVPSLEAVEGMLMALAAEGDGLSPERQAAFVAALGRAKDTITEEAERPIPVELENLVPAMARGDVSARNRTLTLLQELARVNRSSILRADAQARRIGTAGAWAAVFAGLVGFWLGLFVLRRLLGRLVVPILKVDAVLRAAREGDGLRRCVPLTGPIEVVRIGENLNWLLDVAPRRGHAMVPVGSDSLRAALLHHLDAEPRPTLVFDREGLVAMNAAAHGASGDVPTRIAAAVRTGEPVPGWSVTAIVEDRVWRCVQA